jgi:hypothetical protein
MLSLSLTISYVSHTLRNKSELIFIFASENISLYSHPRLSGATMKIARTLCDRIRDHFAGDSPTPDYFGDGAG